MSGRQELMVLQEKLREVLGSGPAATMWAMFPPTEDLATKSDLAAMRDELKGEMAELRGELRGEMAGLRGELRDEMAGLRGEMAEFRTGIGAEIAMLRQEMELKYATRDDVMAMTKGFNDVMQGHVRTFIVVQAATVVGMSGILFGLLRFA